MYTFICKQTIFTQTSTLCDPFHMMCLFFTLFPKDGPFRNTGLLGAGEKPALLFIPLHLGDFILDKSTKGTEEFCEVVWLFVFDIYGMLAKKLKYLVQSNISSLKISI